MSSATAGSVEEDIQDVTGSGKFVKTLWWLRAAGFCLAIAMGTVGTFVAE